MHKESEPSFEHGQVAPELAAVRSSLVEVENKLTAAPVALPYRNTLRSMIAAMNHLLSEMGSEQARDQEFRARIQRILGSESLR